MKRPAGQFGGLLTRLRENVHCQGRKHLPADQVRLVTGEPLTAKPYLNYLRKKYGELDGL